MTYTAPITFTAGATLTAAQLNTNVRDNFKAIGDPWPAYVPTMTNWTLGNGTLTGAAAIIGATVLWRLTFTLGSTTGKTGTLLFSLPATTILPANATVGDATLFDTSGSALRYGFATRNAATTCAVRLDDGTSVNPTNPWTWATGDQIIINGSFEAIP